MSMDEKVTIHDLDLNCANDDDDDDSNVSDESFDHDKEYHNEFDNKTNEDEDYFQNPIQQHHLLLTNSKARSVLKPKKKLVVDEVNDTQSNSGVCDEDDNDYNDYSTKKSGVGVYTDVNTSDSGAGMEPTTNNNADVNRVDVPRELYSDFGDAPYWSNGTIVTDVEY